MINGKYYDIAEVADYLVSIGTLKEGHAAKTVGNKAKAWIDSKKISSVDIVKFNNSYAFTEEAIRRMYGVIMPAFVTSVNLGDTFRVKDFVLLVVDGIAKEGVVAKCKGLAFELHAAAGVVYCKYPGTTIQPYHLNSHDADFEVEVVELDSYRSGKGKL